MDKRARPSRPRRASFTPEEQERLRRHLLRALDQWAETEFGFGVPRAVPPYHDATFKILFDHPRSETADPERLRYSIVLRQKTQGIRT